MGELNGPAVGVLRRAIAEVKLRWSVIRWVTKNVLSRTPPCFGRLVKPLVPATFAVVSTHQPALGVIARSSYVSSIRKACAPAVGIIIDS
jgi:hypothetical protein